MELRLNAPLQDLVFQFVVSLSIVSRIFFPLDYCDGHFFASTQVFTRGSFIRCEFLALATTIVSAISFR